MLGISERTLREWRDRKHGPRPEWRMLFGFSWSYREEAIYRFILDQALRDS